MKKPILSIVASVSTGGVVSAAAFSTNFDEASLGTITGLNKDTPGETNNDYSLNTETDTLDFVTTVGDMWGSRAGAPMAWVTSPVVSLGQTWFVETYVGMEKDGSNTREVAGMGFYGADGTVPDFGLGLDDWNGWNARLQGFGDNNPNVGSVDLGTAPGVFLRTEITEGGETDTYNFFWKVNSDDEWTQLGGVAIDFTASSDNSRVGIFLKSNNGGGGAQFDFLNVDVVGGSADVLEVTEITLTDDNSIELSWTSVPGSLYSVEASTDLENWENLLTEIDAAVAPATLTTVEVDTPAANETKKHYRVRLE
ncbi:MAG: hypothetical protein ACJAVK_001405 [Akkermansiaceae bacterium]|jgi:hypothetical protein